MSARMRELVHFATLDPGCRRLSPAAVLTAFLVLAGCGRAPTANEGTPPESGALRAADTSSGPSAPTSGVSLAPPAGGEGAALPKSKTAAGRPVRGTLGGRLGIGQACTASSDCTSGLCTAGVCVAANFVGGGCGTNA